MKTLVRLFLSCRRARPAFAQDEDAVRAMRLAELKWLLADIAVPGK